MRLMIEQQKLLNLNSIERKKNLISGTCEIIMKKSNIHITGVLGGEEKESGDEKKYSKQ